MACLYILVIPCLSAMTNMVSCWQKNDYDDKACKQQISVFLQCIRNSVRLLTAKNVCVYITPQADTSQLQTASAKRSWWPTEVVNEHLQRFTKKQ